MSEYESKKCPYCQLINPRSAQRCDCGFEFSGPLISPRERDIARWILSGIGLLALGTILTVGISWGLSSSGVSVFFWGLMVSGLVSFGRRIMLILGIR
jgi:hypothetical protein